MASVAFAASQVPGMPPGYAPSSQEDLVAYDRAKIHTELGAQYYGAGQMGVALEEFNTAVAAESRYVPAQYMLGLVYMELKEDARAEQFFKRALELDSGNSEARNNYGWFLCQRGHIEESIKQFMDALKNPLYETPDKPYVNAGICSLKRQDDKSAEEFFLKALKLNPKQPQALLALANLYFRGNDLPNARAQLLPYMKTQTPSAEALWLGVRIERKLGDKNSLESYAEMLRQRFPLSKEAQALATGHYE
jgi:type IV pilus assembly protein PilF